MIEAVVLLLLPVAAALLLLNVRRKHGLPWFVGTSIVFLAAASTFPFFWPEVVFYSRGPLAAAGFEASALPFAMSSIVLICVPPFPQTWLRVGQVVAAVIAAVLWVSCAAWVA